MIRITGGPIRARNIKIPEGYTLVKDGSEFAPGRVGSGPLAYNEATVILNDGDNGQWFKDQVEQAGGGWKEYTEKEKA
jgi:hypothetical protein